MSKLQLHIANGLTPAENAERLLRNQIYRARQLLLELEGILAEAERLAEESRRLRGEG